MPFNDNLASARAAYDAGDYNNALTALNGLIATSPDLAPVLLLAETLLKLGLPTAAAETFEHAARYDSDAPETHLRRAARLYFDAGETDKAAALALDLRGRIQDDPEAAYILISVTRRMGRDTFVEPMKNDLVASDDPAHLALAAELIGYDNRNENNLILYKKLRRLRPDDAHIRMSLLAFAREFCDFEVLEAEEAALRLEFAQGRTDALRAETPHYNLMWLGDEVLNRLASNVPVAPAVSDAAARRLAMPHRWGDKIRIGYLSNDLWDDHATMRLFQSVLTAHDPDRFEVTLFCYTPERFIAFDGGNRQTWGRIVRIEAMDDAEAIRTIRGHNIDILVDLKGHTSHTRSQLMNQPVAPVHVQLLGFPGSCVHVGCDYVIGDPFVLPESSKPHYHEKFCRLPESYQPNDPVHRVSPTPASRRAYGLPTDRFVFCAFNSQRKNSPETMAHWAAVLRANPDAMLWLMVNGNTARQNTADQFRRLGVKANQFLFAPKMAYAAHMARAQAADLGLDSFPYNGHTTTSDMLWAGVPVVTFKGRNFASRVSESLLNAIGLADLVANDPEDFVALCTAIASEPGRITSIRENLAYNRFRAPLFDAERFCRHLETGFETMANRARQGLTPEHFDVPALAPRPGPFL